MNFKFYGQQIVDGATGKLDSYELLLRGGADDVFPSVEYGEYITDHETHIEYIEWLKGELLGILQRHPDVKMSFNLDHQELEYEETFDLLESLCGYANQLIVEITEVSPVIRAEGYTGYFKLINVKAFRMIHAMGYQIALDDVTDGMNSIGNLIAVSEFVSRVKFSIVNFHDVISDETIKKLILFVDSFTNEYQKEFVVEGVEDEELAKWLRENTTSLQQGYLYSKWEKL